MATVLGLVDEKSMQEFLFEERMREVLHDKFGYSNEELKYCPGVIGVPITFLDKYCPEQFEILGVANSARWIGYECYTIIEGRKIYNRILIKR